MTAKCNLIIHGCPSGQQSNAAKSDPLEFTAYIDRFHMGDSRYIESTSKPGEKFIKEILPSGVLAYTFVHTGVHEVRSDRPGSNYAAITLFLPKNVKIQNETKFQQKLKQWFDANVLNKFTIEQANGWRKWIANAEYYLFGGRQDAQIGESLKWLFTYLSTTADNFDVAKKRLQDEIKKLEQDEKRIKQELVKKYAELDNLTNQG